MPGFPVDGHIFTIWTHTTEELSTFLDNLNNFNPALEYTYQVSSLSVDFLDLTIYKGPLFPFTNILDTRTYQKSHNLYQYLHYSSNHDKTVSSRVNWSDTYEPTP